MKSNRYLWIFGIILFVIANPIKSGDRFSGYKDGLEIVNELRKEEPHAEKFASFAYLLPENIRDTFDFEAIHPQPLKDMVMNDVFVVNDKISIISPRFVRQVGENGDIKQLIPQLKTWIDDYKKIYFKNIQKWSDIRGSSFGNSALAHLAMIIWYYSWFLRLLEHPEKPLFTSETNSLEGAEKEKDGLWTLVTYLVFETDPKTKAARSRTMNTIEKTLDELLMSRIRAINTTLTRYEATKLENEKKQSEKSNLEKTTQIHEVNSSQDTLLQQSEDNNALQPVE